MFVVKGKVPWEGCTPREGLVPWEVLQYLPRSVNSCLFLLGYYVTKDLCGLPKEKFPQGCEAVLWEYSPPLFYLEICTERPVFTRSFFSESRDLKN